MPWPTPKNSLKCYQVIDVNLEARLAILVIFTCCSPELLKQCHLGMGNVNACVLKTVLLFILSRYLIDRLWVSIVSSFNHQIAAILRAALGTVRSGHSFCTERFILPLLPLLINMCLLK